MPSTHPAPHLPEGFDASQVHARIAESRENHEQLAAAREGLLAEHEGEWVAVYHGSFLFGPSIEAVIDEAKSASWPLDVIAVGQVSRSRPKVLL